MIVNQNIGLISDTPVVYSKNFKLEYGNFISFKRMMKRFDLQFSLKLNLEDRYQFINSVYYKLDVDAEKYILSMTLLDILVGNEDRHLNNFGIYFNQGDVLCGPLFDFGIGLFEHDMKYLDYNLLQSMDMMYFKPLDKRVVRVVMWLKQNHSDFLKEYLPQYFILNEEMFPNDLSIEYFQRVCRLLEVKVCLV